MHDQQDQPDHGASERDQHAGQLSAGAPAPVSQDGSMSAEAAHRRARRVFLLATAGMLLTGCASGSGSGSGHQTMAGAGTAESSADRRRQMNALRPVRTVYPNEDHHVHTPPPVVEPAPLPAPDVQVIGRQQWATGTPRASLMDPMLPIEYITIHHDGMDPFYGIRAGAVASRIDLIRRSHRGKQWGDIGYHYIVDRAGRVWSGRPLNFQGAHVKDYNEGNIGILNLGNFEVQRPTDAQADGLRKLLVSLGTTYNVSASRIRSHREWSATACPGRSMQSVFQRLREMI